MLAIQSALSCSEEFENWEKPDSLQGIPDGVARAHSSIKEFIKVLIVAKDDMATHVKQEAFWADICACKAASLRCLRDSRSHWFVLNE